MATQRYNVKLGNTETVLQLSADDAKARGLSDKDLVEKKATRKAASAPDNKAAAPAANKAAAPAADK